jgi:adenine-specific DNA-methyltransferase
LLDLLRQAAPEIISDNQLDLERLKELLGEERLAPAEHYELSWAGKAAARREVQKTTSHTLLPSDNPEQAPHMLIEGENLEVLRVLQKSYYGKVKMIYIDPPYNTGNDSFVYPDDYSETLDEYQRRTGEKSEAGFLNKQSLWKKNSKESGQYHSAWLSMMYPRLYLVRNLLRDDGVIFISIDDNEAANLKLLCDEVFGAENFVAEFIWKSRQNKDNRNITGVSVDQEYVLCFSKRDGRRVFSGSERNTDAYSNPDNDPRGNWTSANMVGLATRDARPNLHYDLINPSTGKNYGCPSKGWRYDPNTMRRLICEDRIIWPSDDAGRPRRKSFISEISEVLPGFSSVIKDGIYTNTATRELLDIFEGHVFDFSKPKALLKILSQQTTTSDSLVLDFFAGSGTTAQAVMELNLEDGGNRQCICVQMPEVLEENTEAYKAGYRTIADITRARIDKVIAKLKAEQPEKTTELACAHFTLAPSNFKVWRSDVANTDAVRKQLEIFQQAEKQAASLSETQTAMLTELLLKNGLGALGVHAISKPKALSCGITIHRVLRQDDKHLWLCFEPYQQALKDEIVQGQPAQVILLNSCFIGDKADEQLSNLQLELAGLDIGLLVI